MIRPSCSNPFDATCRLAMASVYMLLVACSGGTSGSDAPPTAGPVDTCDAVSVLENGACRTFGVRIVERAPTPFLENGESISLEVVIYRPVEDGRYPTLVFNHGSTGNGSDPSLFGLTFTSKAVASFFVDRGWIVVFPAHRG